MSVKSFPFEKGDTVDALDKYDQNWYVGVVSKLSYSAGGSKDVTLAEINWPDHPQTKNTCYTGRCLISHIAAYGSKRGLPKEMLSNSYRNHFHDDYVSGSSAAERDEPSSKKPRAERKGVVGRVSRAGDVCLDNMDRSWKLMNMSGGAAPDGGGKINMLLACTDVTISTKDVIGLNIWFDERKRPEFWPFRDRSTSEFRWKDGDPIYFEVVGRDYLQVNLYKYTISQRCLFDEFLAQSGTGLDYTIYYDRPTIASASAAASLDDGGSLPSVKFHSSVLSAMSPPIATQLSRPLGSKEPAEWKATGLGLTESSINAFARGLYFWDVSEAVSLEELIAADKLWTLLQMFNWQNHPLLCVGRIYQLDEKNLHTAIAYCAAVPSVKMEEALEKFIGANPRTLLRSLGVAPMDVNQANGGGGGGGGAIGGADPKGKDAKKRSHDQIATSPPLCTS